MSIKANELRIGDFVEYNLKNFDKGTEKVPLQVVSISKDDGFRLDDGFDNIYTSDDLNQITLTPEILERCGAFSNNHNWLLYPVELNNITTEDYLEFEYQTPYLDWKIISIKYLHQLQNLFFVLTGEELEVGSNGI